MSLSDYYITQVLETPEEYVIRVCSSPGPTCDHTDPAVDHREYSWARDDNPMTVPQMLREVALLVQSAVQQTTPRQLTQYQGRSLEEFLGV